MIVRPGEVTFLDLVEIWRGAIPNLDPNCRAGVDAAASVVAKAAAGEAPIYGINTGFGKLASVRIPPEDTAKLQRNLILSHCAGVGEPLPPAVVRLAMALKLISLGRGASGVRWQLCSLLEDFLSHEIYPVIPAQGSVGASGDLAPLAHMTAALIGEGEVFYKTERLPTRSCASNR